MLIRPTTSWLDKLTTNTEGLIILVRRFEIIWGQSTLNAAAFAMTACVEWCPGPESNRHGVSTEGFSYQLQFSLRVTKKRFVVWTFSLPYQDLKS